mgnify:CR=1 FL=1
MYYKAVRDGYIVDVWDESIIYVKRAGDITIRCTKDDDPFGVLSSGGSTIFATDGSQDYENVTLVPFDDQTAYERLRDEIAAQRTPEYIEPEASEDDDTERVMTGEEMRRMLCDLAERVLTEVRPFTAKQTYKAGDIIADGSRIYTARQVIVAGETVNPGINCTETSTAEVLSAMQAQRR